LEAPKQPVYARLPDGAPAKDNDRDWVDVPPVDDFNDEEDDEPIEGEAIEDEINPDEKPWNNQKVSLEIAKSEQSSDKTLYWEMETDQLVIRLNGIQKALDKNHLEEKDRNEKMLKKDVIQAILQYRSQEPVQEAF